VQKALTFLSAIGAAFLSCGVVNHAQPAPDAAKILADMRQAVGGDAAIGAVQTFSAKGSQTREIAGHSFGADVEWACALPDRFVRIVRVPSPWGSNVEADGFSGDVRILRRESDAPYPPDPHANDSPDQKAERERKALRNVKHEFSRLSVPLLGITSTDPLDVMPRSGTDSRENSCFTFRSAFRSRSAF